MSINELKIENFMLKNRIFSMDSFFQECVGQASFDYLFQNLHLGTTFKIKYLFSIGA
jgi:hypothetical protein